MPKQTYGSPISQAEARLVRYHLVSNLHVILPVGWSAWNKTSQTISDDIEKFTKSEITISADEIEMIAGRVLPQ